MARQKIRLTRSPLLCAVLAALVMFAFSTALQCGFINIDDDKIITENSRLNSGPIRDVIRWAFTTTYFGNWMPVTWLSHLLDIRIFGLQPRGHHGTSLVFHSANSLLLFLILKGVTGSLWRSFIVAVLFAIHPLRVEPVVWISARRDLVSTTFFLLAVGAYRNYVLRPNLGRYLAVAAAFILGLMTKPMLITLPFILLLLDFWPLRRLVTPVSNPFGSGGSFSSSAFRAAVVEKVPLFLVSAAWSVVTYAAQKDLGAVKTLHYYPFASRLSNAVAAYVAYIRKTLWPLDLAVYYPFPEQPSALWKMLASASLLAGISVLVMILHRRHPYLLVGWLWYVGALIPVIGLVQIGNHAMADRFGYIPLIGTFIMMVWGSANLTASFRHRTFVVVGAVFPLVLALLLQTRAQVAYWRDSITLLKHTLDVTADNYLIHNNLGVALSEKGEEAEAIANYREAIRINPKYAEAYNNLGYSFLLLQRWQEAATQLQVAVWLSPKYALAHNNLGLAKSGAGKYAEAIGSYLISLRILPGYDYARYNLGVAYLRAGRLEEAVDAFRTLIRTQPNYAAAYGMLGNALLEQGKRSEAEAVFRLAESKGFAGSRAPR